jgi:hypothetical protein
MNLKEKLQNVGGRFGLWQEQPENLAELLEREQEQAIAYEKILREKQLIEDLSKHAGWKLFTDYADAYIEVLKLKLENEIDVEKFKRLQAEIKSEKKWQKFVLSKIGHIS